MEAWNSYGVRLNLQRGEVHGVREVTSDSDKERRVTRNPLSSLIAFKEDLNRRIEPSLLYKKGLFFYGKRVI